MEEADVNWLLRIPVYEGLDTWTNVETQWSLEDVLEAHRGLAARRKMQEHIHEVQSAPKDQPP